MKKTQSILNHLKSFLLCLFLIPALAWAAPTSNPDIKIVSFNILAPCWASPTLYPASSAPLLNREFRRDRIIAFLQQQASTTPIFALQETTEVELGHIKNALRNQYDMYAAYHSPSYWSNWITIDPPWEKNGVAILVKKGYLTNVTFQDIALSDSGNHSAYLQGKLKSNPQKAIRIASVHLDSDTSYNRDRELKALLQIMAPVTGSIDIIAGDFNFEINNGNLKADLVAAGFKDVLTTLGIDEPTHPFSSTYYKTSNFTDIDHVIVRNATPVDGQVFNFNLWNLYPTDEVARINANFTISGSDHFPVTGTARY